MEPFSTAVIVSALATAASKAAEGVIGDAVKDAYTGLKSLITRKYGDVNIEMLERDPASKTKREVVEQDLAKTGATQDQEVIDATKRLQEELEAAGVVMTVSGQGAVGAGHDVYGAATGQGSVAAGRDISGQVITGDDNTVGDQEPPKKAL